MTLILSIRMGEVSGYPLGIPYSMDFNGLVLVKKRRVSDKICEFG